MDLNLVSIEEMKSLLAVKEDSVGLVVTGIHMKEELFPTWIRCMRLRPGKARQNIKVGVDNQKRL